MRRLLSIGILCFWAAMLVWLVQRNWRPASTVAVPVQSLQPTIGDEWMGVFHHDQKIGYTHYRLAAETDGFIFTEESLLRLTLMETPQTVRTRMRGHVAADFTLRDVEFDLSSGVGSLQASGVVDGDKLRLMLRTGKDTSEQVLSLNEPLYLPSTLHALLGTGSLRAGQQLEKIVFDPTTLTNDRIRVTVEREEPVPHAPPGTQGWRVREEFRGVNTVAWIDSNGVVLREEGPMEMVLVQQSADEALNQGWSGETALDLIAKVAVPVALPIDDARERTVLHLRLSGIDVERVPSDDEQVRNGSELTITRLDADSLRSYPLPDPDPAHAADIAATTFLQSDHPRVQAAAHAAVGDERDARRAAIRINDYVYGLLRKVPTVSLPNALQVLDMGEGDCNEHAVLFAALARAVGLPARLVAGAVYLDGAFLYHAWCEVWLGRWVSIDPALHQFPTDATHIKFAVGGPEQQLAMLEVIGRLGVEVIDDRPHASE